MKQGITCRDICCKHYQRGDICGTNAAIGTGAKCQSFEKGLPYYFSLVWQALSSQNFINAIELTRDLKTGLYCVMCAYHLGYSEMDWVGCRMIGLRDSKDGPLLRTKDILAMDIDTAQVERLAQDLDREALPPSEQKPSAGKVQPYGWLSPTGTFTEADFGEHEAAAEKIIRKKGFINEFICWKPEQSRTRRDFLSDVKGYCLIHDPSGCGRYLVSNTKPLTKRQKEFLYNYFSEMGDRFMAEQFVDDEV